MKIIIAGAGEVGTHLAKLLSREDQDITLMDTDEERLNYLNDLEILTIIGNPTSLRDLQQAGVRDTDIFIGLTPEESVNLTACMLASNLGAVRTVARVSNSEYIHPKSRAFFEKLGVHSLICPEILAAEEIVTSVERPWSRQWWELADGKLILVGVKVRSNAPIVDKYLYDLSREEKMYHIVAIKRGDVTIIPRGSDQIRENDILYFSTLPQYTDVIKQLTGKNDIDIRKITIMGGSRIALKATEKLPHNIRVKIIEINKEKSYRLAEKVESNVMIINGDGRNTDLLLQENIRGCDAFIAVTGNSEANILACVSAKNQGVPKTVAEVENLDYIQMAENLNIGSVINKKLITAAHIYRFLLNADVSTVKSLTFANADVAELVARPGSKVTKKPVKDLNLPKDLTLGGNIREGKAYMIDGESTIQAGDHVVVFCLDTAMRKIEDYFN